jgi:hypothetical protein
LFRSKSGSDPLIGGIQILVGNEQCTNGFDWKFDDSQFEYDIQCKNWMFHGIKNGFMLDCYPENYLSSDMSLLKAIKNY